MAIIKMGDTAYDIPDAVAPGVQQHLDNLNVKIADGVTDLEKVQADLEVVEAKADASGDTIKELELKVADAKTTEEDIEKVLAFRANVKLVDEAFDCSGKKEVDIVKEIVLAKIGDSVKDKSDAYLQARFDILVETAQAGDDLGDAFRDLSTNLGDAAGKADEARAAKVKRSQNAWKDGKE